MDRILRSPVTAVLFGINAAFFITEEIFRIVFQSSLFPLLALSREGLEQGAWWTPVTHAFLHGNLFHLVVNMVALWFTGPLLEETLGRRRYLLLFFGGAVAGGLLQTVATPRSIDLVGASGAVCALLVGFATLFPRLEITALIFFVIPVRMKARTLGWIVILASLLCSLLGLEKGIGHMAHLGGGIAGFLICVYYKWSGVLRNISVVPPPIP
jgi:membrane associated rhomboid family serine protease